RLSYRPRPPRPPLCPYTPLFRSRGEVGVEQRAMLGALSQVDAEALAQFIQRIARARNLALGDLDGVDGAGQRNGGVAGAGQFRIDRKSTRLNSSHVKISYAVFCL